MTRRGFLKWTAGLLAAGTAAGTYAFAAEPGLRLVIRRHAVAPPGWPGDLPMRIVALADPHTGEPHMSLDRLSGIVEAANALEPDLVVLLGDYVAGHRFVAEPVKVAATARVLARLQAPLGPFAVLGNHDWWDDLTAQRKGGGLTIAHGAFAEAGIPVLDNTAARLVHAGRPFWLAGLGDQLAISLGRGRFRGVDDLPGTLARIADDAPAILLAHEPDIFPAVPDRIALTLSGHTHGGQVRLFGWSPVVPSRYGNRYAYGHVVEDDRHLVVSGGLGTSIMPVRFGVPPEITVIDLV